MSKEYPCVYYDNEKCKKDSTDVVTSYCVMGPCSHETPSNADRIRAMSDEELAGFIKRLMFNDFKPACKESTFFSAEHKPECDEDCVLCIMDWLRQPSWVECQSCHAMGQTFDETDADPENAVAAWNRRAEHEPKD